MGGAGGHSSTGSKRKWGKLVRSVGNSRSGNSGHRMLRIK